MGTRSFRDTDGLSVDIRRLFDVRVTGGDEEIALLAP